MKITSFDQIHNRNYKQEKLKKAGIKPQSFVEKLRETTALDPTFATAALLGIEAGKEAGIRALANHTKQFKSSFSVDTAFNTIRKLENRLPLFNIPLRSSQIGDVLTPFVSDEALRWNYNRSEIIESKQGVLRLKDEFQFLNEMAGRDILPELQQGDSRVYFEKTGKVYGNIYLENDQGTKTLGKDVFRMQRPSTKTGAISAIWDAGKRPAHFYKPLSDTWEEPLQKLGFSNEMIKRIRFGGGVARTIIGETTHEFFKGMNRFLKEPIPGLNRLLDSTEEISVKSKLKELGPTGKPFQSVFGHLGEIKSPTNTPFGRLPRWLRPYVHEGYWDKTAGRMAVALAAKGSIYTKLIPSLYGALDYSREKMGGSSAVVTTPLYAAIGMGIGSLVNSGDFNAGVFKNTKLITKTQMGGAIAGAVIGALPVFDKGITAGFGSLYGSANILGARVWDTVGGHKALKRQEELFPGMTNPMTGVGFVLGGGFVGYFNSQLGTAKGILDTTSISQYKLKVGQLNPEEVLKQITSGKLSEAVTDDLVKAFREERIGKIFSVKEAAGVLRGEVKDVKTVVGLMAQTYSELAGKAEIPKEFLERVTTVEGSEELASRLFTHMDELSDIAHKASKASSFEYMSKGFFGRMIDDGKDLLKGRPSFTRGALKGGLAFAGIAQLGAIIAGPVGGNLNPVNLIPGWMISLTGGGYSSKEAEDVYTGKKEVAIRKGRFWSLGSSPWEGCLLPNTFVNINNDKPKQAKDISKEDKLINLCGRKVDIKEISIREAIDEDVYKIQTYYNSESELVVTGNHPILVSEDKQGKSLCWKEAREVLNSDLVFIPQIKHEVQISFIDVDQWLKQFYEFEDNTWYTKRVAPTKYTPDMINEILYWGSLKSKSVERNKQLSYIQDKYHLTYNQIKYTLNDLRKGNLQQKRKIKGVRSKRILLNQDFGRLVGYYAAEGSIARNGLSFSFHSEEDEYHQDVKNLFKKIFGLETSVYQASKSKNGVSIRVNSKIVQDLFQTLVSGTAKNGTKQLNPLLLDAPKEFLLGFIDGFIKGDGSVQNSNSIRIGLHPSHLIEQLQLILNKLGIISSIKKQVKISGGYIVQTLYIPALASYQLNQLIEIKELPLNSISKPKKNYHCFKIDEGFLVKITKLEQDFYSGYVYDFEVSEGSSFLTPQCIVHNSKIEYFRKHRSVLMQSDAEDNALYGSTDEKIAYDPILHPLSFLLDDEFKYHHENRLSLMSPTPLSGRAFSDVPILGDLLGATIGELIKPTKEFRASEWKGSGGAVRPPPGSEGFHEMRSAPAVSELGGLSYQARDQNSMYSVTKDTFKRITEQAGLRGFMLSAALEDVGYRDRTYDPVIERSDSLLSARAKFWSLNLGDPMGLSEAARRYLTKDRNVYYNPLSNMAPSWLPENDYWQDFKHGNYFSKVKEGWLRLPGRGYETLNPELQGLHPENYSIGHKYKILSDVAYGSNEYLAIKEKAKQSIASGSASKRDLELIATANQQLGEKKIKRSFRDYQFDKEYSREREFTVLGVADDGSIITAETGKRQLKLAGLDMSMAAFTRKKLEEENFKTIADAERAASESRSNALYEMRQALQPGTKIKGHMSLNDDDYGDAISELYIPTLNEKVKELGAEVDKDSSFRTTMQYNAVQRFFGKAWESYTHNADLPITPGMAMNKIAPFQPHSKFVKRLTPIELYAQTRVYGRELQMWQNYGEDFIGTAFNEVKAKMFGDSIPAKVEYQRTMVEYFDKLKWLKYHSLEQASQMHDNSELSEYYAQKKKQTMYGADPYRGYSDIFRALPGTERDFYREFVNETDPDNQSRILELAPEAMKRIYIAQWQNKRIKSLGNKAEAGIADASEKAELKNLYKLRESEGFVKNHELEHQYKQETQGSDLSYADWVRLKELKEYFKAFKLPKANFVGYDPRVDLEDVKLKVAQNEGCILEGENLLTNNLHTEEKVENIIDFILNKNLLPEKILDKITRYIENEKVYKISNGGFSLKLTANHIVPFVYRTNGAYKLSEDRIENIVKKDRYYFLYPKLKLDEVDSFIYLTDFTKKPCIDNDQERFTILGGHRSFPLKVKADYVLGMFLGWWVAEGSLARNYKVIFNLNAKTEQHVAEWLCSVASEYFNASSSIRKYRNNDLRVTICSKILHNICLSYFGKGSLNKKINSALYDMPKEFLLGLLNGWFLGDGWSTDKESCVSTSSKDLAFDGWLLLNSLGFRARLQTVKPAKEGKKIRSKESYRIRIGYAKKYKYFFDLGLACPPDSWSSFSNRFFYFRGDVSSENFSGNVYDFQLASRYMCSKAILIHNSDIHDIGLWDQQAESVKRKPYVDGGASLLSDWHETPQTESEFEADVRRMIREASNKIHLAPVRGLGNRVIVQAQDTREIDVRRHLQKGMF